MWKPGAACPAPYSPLPLKVFDRCQMPSITTDSCAWVQLAARMETVRALEMPAVVMKKSGLGRAFGALAKRAEPELQRVADAAT